MMKNQNYDEFCESIKTEVANRVSECKVSILRGKKINNVKKIGLVFEEKSLNMTPVIYLEKFYKEYLQGNNFNEIVKEIVLLYHEAKKGNIIDTEKLMNFEDIKNKIGLKLINTENNREFLEFIPSIPFLDLSIIFYIIIETNPGGLAEKNITNEDMDIWEVSGQDLWEHALKNSSGMFSAVLQTMDGVIKERQGAGKEENLFTENIGKKDNMYVLSNQLKCYGASCIAYPGVPEMIWKILKSDYYIIPSSTEEMIIIPEHRISGSVEEWNAMLYELNSAHIAAEKVLSNHCYRYIRFAKKVVII